MRDNSGGEIVYQVRDSLLLHAFMHVNGGSMAFPRCVIAADRGWGFIKMHKNYDSTFTLLSS